MEVLPDWSLSPRAESKTRQLGFFPMTDGALFTLFRRVHLPVAGSRTNEFDNLWLAYI